MAGEQLRERCSCERPFGRRFVRSSVWRSESRWLLYRLESSSRDHTSRRPVPRAPCLPLPHACIKGAEVSVRGCLSAERPRSVVAREPPRDMQSLRRLRVPAVAALPRRFACEARPAAKAPPTAEVLALSAELQRECAEVAARGGRLAWVFLGAPGVGKGTYASRVAALMGVPHVSAGDLVRAEIKAATPLAKQARAAQCSPERVARRRSRDAFCPAAQMAEITGKGQLLPDELVLRLLQRRLAEGAAAGERGVLLDGFPRTRAQAVRGGPDRGCLGVAAVRQCWRLKLKHALRRRAGHAGRAGARAGGAQLEPARGGTDREGTHPQLLLCPAAVLACAPFFLVQLPDACCVAHPLRRSAAGGACAASAARVTTWRTSTSRRRPRSPPS